MKYLILIVIFLTISCNRPDYYVCSDKNQDKISEYIKECLDDDFLSSCTNSAQELFCTPAYKPKNVEECNCPDTINLENITKEW